MNVYNFQYSHFAPWITALIFSSWKRYKANAKTSCVEWSHTVEEKGEVREVLVMYEPISTFLLISNSTWIPRICTKTTCGQCGLPFWITEMLVYLAKLSRNMKNGDWTARAMVRNANNSEGTARFVRPVPVPLYASHSLKKWPRSNFQWMAQQFLFSQSVSKSGYLHVVRIPLASSVLFNKQDSRLGFEIWIQNSSFLFVASNK